MLSGTQIVEIAEQAGNQAYLEDRKPIFLTTDQLFSLDNAIQAKNSSLATFTIPNLGNYTPKGYTRQEYFTVSKFGWNRDGGGAEGVGDLFRYIQHNPQHGYAIIEEGEFQIVIGVFKNE